MTAWTPLYPLALSCVFLLSGCATPPQEAVAAGRQADADMDCAGLQTAYRNALRVQMQVATDKSAGPGNRVRAVMFWSSLSAAVGHADSARAALTQRLQQLETQLRAKGCEVPAGPLPEAAKGADKAAAASEPLPMFRARVLDRRERPATASLLTLRDDSGQVRRVQVFNAPAPGACVELLAAAVVPRGLLDYEVGEVQLRPADGCTG